MRREPTRALCALRRLSVAAQIALAACVHAAEPIPLDLQFGPIGAAPDASTVVQINALNRALGLPVATHADIRNKLCVENDYCAAAAAIDLALWLQQSERPPHAATLSSTELNQVVAQSGLAIPTAEDVAPAGAPVRLTPADPAPASEAPATATAANPATEPARGTASGERAQPAAPAPSPAPHTQRPASDRAWMPWLAGVLLLLTLVLLPLFVLRRRQRARTVHDLIHEFYRRVDLAKQHHADDSAAADAQVAKAFDQLHAEARQLLDARKIRLADLKRAMLRFHSPEPSESSRWAPPTLSQLGYVLCAADKAARDTPVLALYKYSGEARGNGGQVLDTYTIFKEGNAQGFSDAFAAKVQSPFAIRYAAPDIGASQPEPEPQLNSAPVARPDEGGETGENSETQNSDYHFAYVLSLVAHDDTERTTRVKANLEALLGAALVPDAEAARSAFTTHAHLLSLINEDLRERPAQLALSLAALREAPQVLLAALADLRRQQLLPDAVLMPLTDKIRIALGVEARSAAAEHRQRMFEFVLRMQGLTPLAAADPLPGAGVVYVDARGAEASAGFLQRLAQLTMAAAHAPLIMVSELTRAALRAQILGYAQLQPSREHEAALATLTAAIDARRLTLHTVPGSQPLHAADVLRAHGANDAEPLIVCVDPAAAVLEGMAPSWQYVLWTLSGQMLVADRHLSLAFAQAAQRLRAGRAAMLNAAA